MGQEVVVGHEQGLAAPGDLVAEVQAPAEFLVRHRAPRAPLYEAARAAISVADVRHDGATAAQDRTDELRPVASSGIARDTPSLKIEFFLIYESITILTANSLLQQSGNRVTIVNMKLTNADLHSLARLLGLNFDIVRREISDGTIKFKKARGVSLIVFRRGHPSKQWTPPSRRPKPIAPPPEATPDYGPEL